MLKKSVSLFFIGVLVGLQPAGYAQAQTQVNSDLDAVCRIPFETLKDPKTGATFPIESAINPNKNMGEHLRQRYIVADYNTKDENGKCKGVQEYYASAENLSDFENLNKIAKALKLPVGSFAFKTLKKIEESVADSQAEDKESLLEMISAQEKELSIELADLASFVTLNLKFGKAPFAQKETFNGYCIGQTLNYCEIKNDKPTLIFKFITSSSKNPVNVRQYYAPINTIATRHWSSDRPYTPADIERDNRLGGGDNIALPYANGGHPIEMPNFMNFVPLKGYPGETLNGIHQIAGGNDSGGQFGAPVSLGCSRLKGFQSKLSRWWTPREARMYIYLDESKYVPFAK